MSSIPTSGAPVTLQGVVDRITEQYNSYDSETPQALEDMTAPFNRGMMIDLLADILKNPQTLEEIAKRSRQHENGFEKIVLAQSDDQGWKLRLHIWHPEAASAEDLHDHRWNFSSHLLTGMYFNWEYYQDPAVESHILSDAQYKVLDSFARLERQYRKEEMEKIISSLKNLIKGPEKPRSLETVRQDILPKRAREIVNFYALQGRSPENLSESEASLTEAIHNALGKNPGIRDKIFSEMLGFYQHLQADSFLKALDITPADIGTVINAFEENRWIEAEAQNKLRIRINKEINKTTTQRMNALYKQIETVKALMIGNATSIRHLEENTEDSVSVISRLCDTLGVTSQELKEYMSVFHTYEFPGQKSSRHVDDVGNVIANESAVQPVYSKGYSVLEGPHITRVTAGMNRLQAIRPFHRLLVDPSLSGTTSSVILTESPRDGASQVMKEAFEIIKDDQNETPALPSHDLRESLTRYRNLLITHQIMEETFAAIVVSQKEPHILQRSFEQDAPCLETYFLPQIQTYRDDGVENGMTQALENVLNAHPPEFRDAFEMTLVHNTEQHNQGLFQGSFDDYYKGEQDTLRLKSHIQEFARQNVISASFDYACRKGINAGMCHTLNNLAENAALISPNTMEAFWFLYETTKNKDNAPQWQKTFSNIAVRFLTQNAPLSEHDIENLTARIKTDGMFTGFEDTMVSRLNAYRNEAVEDENRFHHALWKEGEVIEMEPNAERLQTAKGRYGYMGALSRFVSNLVHQEQTHMR